MNIINIYINILIMSPHIKYIYIHNNISNIVVFSDENCLLVSLPLNRNVKARMYDNYNSNSNSSS